MVVGTGQQITDGAGNVTQVGGVPSSGITPIVGLMPVEVGADNTLNHVKTAVDQGLILNPSGAMPQIQSGLRYWWLVLVVIANDPSDVFNLQATLLWQPNGTTFTNPATIFSFMTGWVDAPALVGTTPLWGGTYSAYPWATFAHFFNGFVNPWSGGTYMAFGFGTASTITSTPIAVYSPLVSSNGYWIVGGVSQQGDWDGWQSNPYLTYIYATLQQISS